MFIRKVFDLHLAGQRPRCLTCFPGVCECLVQVRTPFTHPQRAERNWQWCKGIALFYLKIGQCLVLKKMVSKYSLGSCPTQPTGKAGDQQAEWWLGAPACGVCSIWGNKDAKNAANEQEPWQYLVGGGVRTWQTQNWKPFRHVWCWKHSLVTHSWKDSKWLHKTNS